MTVNMYAFRKIFLVLFLIVISGLISCSENREAAANPPEEKNEIAKIAVISDPHYFDPSLGTSGPDLEAYLQRDRKMLAESESILKSAIDNILTEDVEIVLVSGDLTKDGEQSSHVKFAQLMEQLESAGKKVFVVPGNHDINNYGAYSYSSNGTSRVPNITPEQFKEIYKNFGYDEALYRDSNSLSYIAEPAEGLWIFGMDACKFNLNNAGNTEHGGAFSDETLNWIKLKLQEAKLKNKTAIGILHHGMLEHFSTQKALFNEFVIDNWQKVSNDLADNGMNIVFTGHFHAQDIVKMQFPNGSFLFDIETGSLVTYPVPYRVVNLYSDGTLNVNTMRVTQINYDTNGKSFQDYAKEKLEQNAEDILNNVLADRIQLTKEEIAEVLPVLKESFIAHAQGDENPSSEYREKILDMLESNDLRIQLVGNALNTIFNDPLPGDNNIEINLKTGEAKSLNKFLTLEKIFSE